MLTFNAEFITKSIQKLKERLESASVFEVNRLLEFIFIFIFFSRNSVCQKFNPHFIHLYHLPFLFFSISLILRSYFYLIFFGFTCYYILFIYSKPSLLVYKETTYVATWSMKNLLGNSVLSVTVYKKKISDQLR